MRGEEDHSDRTRRGAFDGAPPGRGVSNLIGRTGVRLMSRARADDGAKEKTTARRSSKRRTPTPPVGKADAPGPDSPRSKMTAFVDACVETVTGSAQAAVRRSHGHPHARHLLKVLS